VKKLKEERTMEEEYAVNSDDVLIHEENRKRILENQEKLWKEIQEKTIENYKSEQKQCEMESNFNYSQGAIGRYEPSPREYLHNFLLQAMHAGCDVSKYINAEINKMLAELER
jgi:virulence-associated protein VagC